MPLIIYEPISKFSINKQLFGVATPAASEKWFVSAKDKTGLVV